MKGKKLWSILLLAAILGNGIIFIKAGNITKAAEAIEIAGMDLTEDIVYDNPVIIRENINLNGCILQVNGDLEIAGNVTLDRGTLLVNGNILHTSGSVRIGQGIVQVSGDYRIQSKKRLPDGTEQFLESRGGINMEEADGQLKIGGDFIVQAAEGNYSAGTMEIGGNIIQKNAGYNTRNLNCTWNHRLVLTGEGAHRIELENCENRFASLESKGKIICSNGIGIDKMLSDLTMEAEDGGEFILGGTNINGKELDILSDVRITGNIELNGGILKVEGSVLQADGAVRLGYGIIEVSGDYRIQNTRKLPDGTIQYIGSDAVLKMDEMDGLLMIKGDFVTQSNRNSEGWGSDNTFYAGTMEVGGDVIQKNGDSSNFYCWGNHKLILNGDRIQKVKFESEKSKLNYLKITRSFSDYTFEPNPCWETLEESAISLSECTVEKISKKAYTGKAIKPAVTVTYQDTKLIPDKDYTVAYSNNKNTGKASVTITGIGAYTGTVEKSFSIVPAKVGSVKAVSDTAKQVTLTWKKDTKATGYILEYSTDKTFKKNVSKITVSKKETVSREITKLASKKTYYFRIRAYKTIDGKKAYGAYSSIVSVSVK